MPVPVDVIGARGGGGAASVGDETVIVSFTWIENESERKG